MRIDREFHAVKLESNTEDVVPEKETHGGKSSGRPQPQKVAKETPATSQTKPKEPSTKGGKRLTKEEKKQAEAWATNRSVQLASMIRELKERKAKQFGANSVYIGSELEKIEIGIPMPSLSMQYLFQRDVFPLGVIIQISAKHSSFKSALLAELLRWFYDYGGAGYVTEVENKISAELFSSILSLAYFEMLSVSKVDSLEGWQESLHRDIDNLKAELIGTKKKRGPGAVFPVLFGVDSIVGKMTEETQEEIEKQGHAGRGYPVEANSITRYVKTLAGWLRGWPFSVICINQTKTKIATEGTKSFGSKDSRSGGDQLNFSESIDLELHKWGRFQCDEFEGYKVDIKMVKNSVGPDARKVTTRMLWWEEPDDTTESGFRQKTIWDWGWATTNLLQEIMGGESREPRFKVNLKEMGFHLHCPTSSAIENLAWSKNLGMKSEDQAVSWNELGMMIHADHELMRKLKKALAIRVRPKMEGDYRHQFDNSLKKIT